MASGPSRIPKSQFISNLDVRPLAIRDRPSNWELRARQPGKLMKRPSPLVSSFSAEELSRMSGTQMGYPQTTPLSPAPYRINDYGKLSHETISHSHHSVGRNNFRPSSSSQKGEIEEVDVGCSCFGGFSFRAAFLKIKRIFTWNSDDDLARPTPNLLLLRNQFSSQHIPPPWQHA